MPGAKDIDAEAHPPAPQTALFPLNRSWRLAGDIHHHAIHSFHLIHDPIGDRFHQVVGKPRPISGHAVLTRDTAQHDRSGIGALISHYTH